MLTCVIIDDEYGAIEILKGYVEKTPFIKFVNSFRDPLEALSFLNKEKVDLIFLDINMPNLSGMQFLEVIKNPPMVIFTTAYEEYALESYEKNAVDYLLKPIEFERFLKAVTKAADDSKVKPQQADLSPSKNKEDFIIIKSGNKMHKVRYDAILFLEKQKHYISFETKKGSFLSRISMNEIEQSLPREKFVRVHRSFIINIDQIDMIQSYQVIISKNKIPIGASYRDGFFKMFNPTGS